MIEMPTQSPRFRPRARRACAAWLASASKAPKVTVRPLGMKVAATRSGVAAAKRLI
ncbi:hypothetical protein D3C81_2136820 [compost metagenome]